MREVHRPHRAPPQKALQHVAAEGSRELLRNSGVRTRDKRRFTTLIHKPLGGFVERAFGKRLSHRINLRICFANAKSFVLLYLIRLALVGANRFEVAADGLAVAERDRLILQD